MNANNIQRYQHKIGLSIKLSAVYRA